MATRHTPVVDVVVASDDVVVVMMHIVIVSVEYVRAAVVLSAAAHTSSEASTATAAASAAATTATAPASVATVAAIASIAAIPPAATASTTATTILSLSASLGLGLSIVRIALGLSELIVLVWLLHRLFSELVGPILIVVIDEIFDHETDFVLLLRAQRAENVSQLGAFELEADVGGNQQDISRAILEVSRLLSRLVWLRNGLLWEWLQSWLLPYVKRRSC